MGNVDGRDSPYVFTSKVHYYIMNAHLLCTNYVNSFLLKLRILNQVLIMHINDLWHINSLHPAKKMQWDTKSESL